MPRSHVRDPWGRFAAAAERSGPAVEGLFSALAVNVTSETHPTTVRALQALDLPAALSEHGAGTVGIGTARKDAVALGLGMGSARLFYSDLDHVLRWVSTSSDEVRACFESAHQDFLIVGRSPAAMGDAPERLQATEELVNHVYGLANGLADRWDLMIAMRLMTRDAAATIVDHSQETSIAGDVSWPMLVRARGGTVGYFEADGIRFRERDDFGEDQDGRDHDPREWLARMKTAVTHVEAIVHFDPA